MLALGVAALVAVALLSDIVAPRMLGRWQQHRIRRRRTAGLGVADPGRERRAEQRARDLLRSCVGDDDWAMYRELGFLRVWSTLAREEGGEVAYLIYPHRPLISYTPATSRLLSEYCVTFPDETRPYGSPRLPDSDDVLAKWMALTGDERRILAESNAHLPGHQHDVQQVARDIWRLSRWERMRPATYSAAPPARRV